jgi:hypothetical protein
MIPNRSRSDCEPKINQRDNFDSFSQHRIRLGRLGLKMAGKKIYGPPSRELLSRLFPMKRNQLQKDPSEEFWKP